jgi:hypothetical protein
MSQENSEIEFEELVEIALRNALEDRKRAVEAFEKTKKIYDIDVGEEADASSMQGLMLIGQTVSKLLEIGQKSNEQVIKLAGIKKDKKPKKDEDDDNQAPIDLSELDKHFGGH